MKKRIILAGLLLTTVSTAQAQDKQVVDAIASSLNTTGLLTPKGQFEIEPAISYSQNTSTRVSILGYSVLPAIVVGLIQAEDQDLATFTTSVAARYGLTDRIDLELRAPWVYRYDSYRFREVSNGVDSIRTVNSDGGDLGDIEAAVRYQYNLGSAPFWIGGIRVKSDTGRSPFDEPLDSDNIFVRPPTGNGSWSVEPSITMIYPTDPAVIFGTLGYTYNFETTAGRDLNNDGQANDDIKLGDSIFLGMGAGFAVNNRLSFSFGINHRTVFKSQINGVTPDSSKMLQLDSLTLGLSMALTERTTLNMNLQAGLTEDAPDVQLNFSLPITF